MNYTNEAMMASALNLTPDCTLTNPGGTLAGANILQVSGGTFYSGQTLAVDYFAPTTREVATILSFNGTTISLTANLVNPHPQGAPIKEVTSMTDVVSAASRMWDDITFYHNTFGQETVTETRKGHIDSDGMLVVTVSKPIIQSISSVSLIRYPGDSPYPVSLSDLDFDGFYIRGNIGWFKGKVTATITYVGGYNPVPGDIQRATTALACRMWKEKDSGFSDVIGNSELGVLQYKKGVPNDVEMIAKHYRRWVP